MDGVNNEGLRSDSSLLSYRIIYYPFVDPYRITKSMNVEIITFLGLESLDQHKAYQQSHGSVQFF
jgi:hypothetical protein